MNRKSHLIYLGVCGILAASLLLGHTGYVSASDEYYEDEYYDDEYYDDEYYEDEYYEEPIVTATPTPEPHTEFYEQPAETDAIAGWPAGPQIEAGSAVLMDMDTGAVLYSKNADAKRYPASITKVMTALLGCENLDPNASMTVSEAAAYGIEPGSSSIYAETDEQFTIHQALMAVMLESANEMSLAIAEETSGSVKKFVELMNERAVQIGCTHTHFNNPNGLPDELHYTSANDMAKIARTAWSNLRFRSYVTTDYFEMPPTNKQPETRYWLNHHGMMAGHSNAYEGVLGGKTGYTNAAGSTLVTYASREGLNLVCVVMKSIDGAYADTAALLDYGFNNFEKINLNVEKEPSATEQLPSEKYLLKNSENLNPFYYRSDVYVTVPAGTDPGTLAKKEAVLFNAAGPYLLKSFYFFDTQLVGHGTQYEREILSDLLLR